MKKAVLISGILWGIACVLSGIIVLALGGLASAGLNSPEASQILASAASESSVTPEQARAILEAALGVYFTIGAWLLVGGIFSFVLAGVRNSGMSKGAGIAMGIIGIVVGAELPGIFFIIDSAKNR